MILILYIILFEKDKDSIPDDDDNEDDDDFEILDEMTTNRGEIKIRTMSFDNPQVIILALNFAYLYTFVQLIFNQAYDMLFDVLAIVWCLRHNFCCLCCLWGGFSINNGKVMHIKYTNFRLGGIYLVK